MSGWSTKLVRARQLIQNGLVSKVADPTGQRWNYPAAVVSRLAIECTLDSYEDDLVDEYRAILARSSGAFIDVGANVGQTLVALVSIDADRRYVGFEPQVEACAEVARFISRNRLARHDVLPMALSDHDGIGHLEFENESDVRASLAGDFRPADFFDKTRAVPVAKGDTVLAQLEVTEVAVIKVDVEGAELEVLEGFRSTLESARPEVTFEVLPNHLVSTGEKLDATVIEARMKRFEGIERFLGEVGYEIFRLQGGGRVPASVSPDSHGTVLNLVAAPALGAD